MTGHVTFGGVGGHVTSGWRVVDDVIFGILLVEGDMDDFVDGCFLGGRHFANFQSRFLGDAFYGRPTRNTGHETVNHIFTFGVLGT